MGDIHDAFMSIYELIKQPVDYTSCAQFLIPSCPYYSPTQVFLGTWPIPAYVNDDKPTVYLASGTDREYRLLLQFIYLYKSLVVLTWLYFMYLLLQKHVMHTHSLYNGQ